MNNRHLFEVACLLAIVAAAAIGCGPRPGRIPDGGVEDAGVDGGEDAGRPAGEDPPTGYTLAIEQSTTAAATDRLGVSAVMILDQHQQPATAYVHEDPNGDGVAQDGRVMFSRWNGVEKAWSAPKVIETIGQIDTAHPLRQVSLARDPSNGRLAIAYVTSSDRVNLAVSDDEGENWSIEVASAPNPNGDGLSNPVIALHDGTLHLAYHQANKRCSGPQCGAVLYRSRSTAGPGGLTDPVLVPLLAGTEANPPLPVSLALDPGGQPALAYFLETSADNTVSLAFWRPGSGAATKVVDSENVASPQASVSLAFGSSQAHLAFHLGGSDPAVQLRYCASTDLSGIGWASPVAIPRNGSSAAPDTTQWYQAIAVSPSGKVAIAAYFAPGAPAQQCGGPKLARSTDGLAFNVCSPDGGRVLNSAGLWPSLAFGKNDKLTLGFLYDQKFNPSLKPGVVLWREP